MNKNIFALTGMMIGPTLMAENVAEIGLVRLKGHARD